MRREGTDESNVQMSDVLCDFCRGQWTEDRPMVEGHHGSCICGNCLSVAFADVAGRATGSAEADYSCTMCMEAGADRAELNRPNEPGWQSPMYPDAWACRRCIKLGAGTLHKDPDIPWSKPG